MEALLSSRKTGDLRVEKIQMLSIEQDSFLWAEQAAETSSNRLTNRSDLQSQSDPVSKIRKPSLKPDTRIETPTPSKKSKTNGTLISQKLLKTI